MGNESYELTVFALRVIFLTAIPVVLITAVVGSIASALQTVTTVHDTALSYAARLAAVVVSLYFLYPTFSRSVLELAERAWR